MRIAEDVRAVWNRSWTTPWAWLLLVSYNMALGAVFLLGGEGRINGPSFKVIREIGYGTTGGLFLAAGLLIALAVAWGRRALGATAFVAAVLHLLLAAGFLAALLAEPPVAAVGVIRPALTGVPTYLFVAVVHFINAFVYGRRGPLGERGGSA